MRTDLRIIRPDGSVKVMRGLSAVMAAEEAAFFTRLGWKVEVGK